MGHPILQQNANVLRSATGKQRIHVYSVHKLSFRSPLLTILTTTAETFYQQQPT